MNTLFNGIAKKSYGQFFNQNKTVDIYSPIFLRDRIGFIPGQLIKSRALSDSLSVIAFPIFLADKKLWSDSLFTNNTGRNPDNSLKLLQVVLYDTKNNKFIAKPENYPLEAEDWFCTGDFCNIMDLISFEKVVKNEPAFAMRFITSVTVQYLQVHYFTGDSIFSSAQLREGNLAGESGYEVSIAYENFQFKNGNVIADLKSNCNAEIDFCNSLKLKTGNNIQSMVILKVNNENK